MVFRSINRRDNQTTGVLRHPGFTIVELLIVIVVVGILAAISVVAYNGIQDRTNSSVIASDLSNFAKKAELFKVENDRYPLSNVDELATLNYSATHSSYPSQYNWNLDYCPTPDGREYVITVKLTDSIVYVSSKSSTPVEFSPSNTNYTIEGQGYQSPCYTGSDYSAADHAGISDNRTFNSEGRAVGGFNGLGQSGWRKWAGGNI